MTSDLLTTGGASTRWLDLLAADAAQADNSFSLAPTPTRDRSLAPNDDIQNRVTQGEPFAVLDDADNLPTNREHAWQESVDITLLEHEKSLFRHFADHAALWVRSR